MAWGVAIRLQGSTLQPSPGRGPSAWRRRAVLETPRAWVRRYPDRRIRDALSRESKNASPSPGRSPDPAPDPCGKAASGETCAFQKVQILLFDHHIVARQRAHSLPDRLRIDLVLHLKEVGLGQELESVPRGV